MAQDAGNVLVGVTGAIYVAPEGTPVPTTVNGVLNGAFEELGYVDESGVAEATTVSTTNKKAWQNGVVVRKLQTEHDTTYTFTLIETNEAVLDLYYGNHADGLTEINAGVLPNLAFVIDVLDGDDKVRTVIPSGQVTNRGTVSYVNGDSASYTVTITAFEDPAYAGDLPTAAKAYKYFSTDGAPSA